MTEDLLPWSAWRAAVQRPEIERALAELYRELDGEVRARGPVCWASGRCCHFDEYGHRLYVTGLEIAWVVGQRGSCEFRVSGCELGKDGPLQVMATPNSKPETRTPKLSSHGSCPFQVNHLCGIHPMRPLGCRVFFCQRGTEDWQRAWYERFLGRLRALHDRHALPYRYLEWRAGLQAALDSGLSL